MQKNGFSLVELSVVLVVIGLLVGGIIVGKRMIRASEVKTTVADFQRYKMAVDQFRDQYTALPGDMSNATSYWGIAAGTTGSDETCYAAVQSSGATCNGNGDHSINGTNATGSVYDKWNERYLAWSHLAAAGLIEGRYSGRTTSTTVAYSVAPGVNVPGTKLNGATFDLFTLAIVAGEPYQFPDSTVQGTTITLFGPNLTGTVTPEEDFLIDTKFDDGKPGTGSIFHPKKTSAIGTGCVTTDSASTAAYDLTNKNAVCIIQWLL